MTTIRPAANLVESNVAFRKNARGSWDLIKHPFARGAANLSEVQKANTIKLAHRQLAHSLNTHFTKTVLRVHES